jgi:hypothetical protein
MNPAVSQQSNIFNRYRLIIKQFALLLVVNTAHQLITSIVYDSPFFSIPVNNHPLRTGGFLKPAHRRLHHPLAIALRLPATQCTAPRFGRGPSICFTY